MEKWFKKVKATSNKSKLILPQWKNFLKLILIYIYYVYVGTVYMRYWAYMQILRGDVVKLERQNHDEELR